MQSTTSIASIFSWALFNAGTKHRDEDAQSLVDSDSSKSNCPSTSDVFNMHKKPPRPRTIYSLAHPPPGTKRPRLVLQLRLNSASLTPKPAFEVVPSSALTSRFWRRSSRTVRSKTGLEQNDLVVFRAEDYDFEHADSAARTSEDTREPVGVISDSVNHSPTTEICLGDDVIWQGRRARGGVYEFTTMRSDGEQQITRWVACRGNSKGTTHSSARRAKFKFALVQSNSRLNPFLGSLEFGKMEIYDWIKLPINAEYSDYLTLLGEGENDLSNLDTNFTATLKLQPCAQLRSLLLLSGIWVGLMENWSNIFRYGTATSSLVNQAGQSSSQISVAPSEGTSTSLRQGLQYRVTLQGRADSLKPALLRACTGTLQPVETSNTADLLTSEPRANHVRTVSTGSAYMQRHASLQCQKLPLPMDGVAWTDADAEARAAHANPSKQEALESGFLVVSDKEDVHPRKRLVEVPHAGLKKGNKTSYCRNRARSLIDKLRQIMKAVKKRANPKRRE